MIRRLRLRGWRAFDDVTLEVGDGLTFVVAENGVGKTSLVQAAAWGLYGGVSKVDARGARRVGASATSVEVSVELPDGRILDITRGVHERSEPVRARIGRTELDGDGLNRALVDAFGASREFLSMTTVLPSETIADDAAGAFHLQTHLRRVFGVDDLQRAADALRRLGDEADAAARKVRQASRRAAADLSRLRAELAQAEITEAAAQTARTDSRRVVTFAETQLLHARELEAARAKAAVVKEEFARLLSQTRQALGRATRIGRVTQPGQLAVHLDTAEVAAADALDEDRREAAIVAGQLVAVRSAAAAVHLAEAECPVCRRDLSADDVARASAAHEREVNALLKKERVLATRVTSASRRLAELRALGRRVARLPELVPVGDDEAVDLAAATFAVQAAREEAERVDERAATARARRVALSAQVVQEEQNERAAEEAHAAHRRQAVASVAAEVMRSTADAIVAERIDPLAAEISQRWKRVFGERGSLQLRSDGRLVLVRGIHEIPFTQFSSGEKVVALLATRLLVLGASTRASFLWLDEPLEHLDPANRRITASLMGAAGTNVRQILVTTYEESLARRLAATASAQLLYVRTPER